MQHHGRIEIFLEVARLQSFAKAAKALGMTGPAASKQVMTLEDELGVKLLHRTTRLVTLTDEGALYYERARQAIDELKEAAEQLRDVKTAPRGTLKINVPIAFGQEHLMPVLSGFARKYPQVQMEVTMEDRMVDVIADGFDVVIRISALSDSTLSSRHLGECPILLVASPEYLAQHGMPSTPAELSQHRMISYSYQGAATEWRYRDPSGRIGAVRGEGVFRSNNANMMLHAALDGIGIAVLPGFTVATHVKAGKLVRLLPEYTTYPARSITALTPPNRHRSAKVQLLLDWLARACKAMPLSV